MIGFTLAEIALIAVISLVICTLATSLAMESAALFLPAFLILFPVLIPGFPILGPNEAIGAILVIMFFGQTSTLLRYWYQGQVLFRLAATALVITVPLAIVGRLLSYFVPPSWLLVVFAVLLFGLAAGVMRAHAVSSSAVADPAPGDVDRPVPAGRGSSNGGVASYDDRSPSNPPESKTESDVTLDRRDRLTFGSGGLLAGLVGFGIGELSNTTLHLRKDVPITWSTGTSTLVLYLTLLTATLVNIVVVEFDLVSGAVAIPWELAVIVAPVVLVGGQLGAIVNARLPDHLVVKLLVGAYLFVGVVTTLRVLV